MAWLPDSLKATIMALYGLIMLPITTPVWILFFTVSIVVAALEVLVNILCKYDRVHALLLSPFNFGFKKLLKFLDVKL